MDPEKTESETESGQIDEDEEVIDDLEAEGVSLKVMTLAKRRGFFWSSNEIYGGLAGFYDYGPLGTRLECNLVDIWREIFVIQEGFAEITTPTITPYEVFSASGHIKEFTDLMVECRKCGEPYRADHLLSDHVPNPDSLTAPEINSAISEYGVNCPSCSGDLSEAYPFNLMFETSIGPGAKKRVGFLRPETAQGMFINFHLLYRHFREKLPFGVVQIGSAYRNEISPRQGMIRLREFKMAELEYFLDPENKSHTDFHKIKDLEISMFPATAQQPESGEPQAVKMTLGKAIESGTLCNETLAYFIALTYQFLAAAGFSDRVIRFRQHLDNEKAHYAEDCWDAEINTTYGWIECVGIADRSCYDLEQHNKASGHTLAVSIHHKEPIERTVKKIIVNNRNLGQKYKALAKKLKTAIEEMDGDTVPDSAEPLEVEIDGEKHTIDRDCFELKTVVEKEFGRKIVPHVIEPSFGLDRLIYALIENAYYERENGYRVLHLKPMLAPIDVGVFPLMSKPELVETARQIIEMLTCRKLITFYDEAGSIGRRYARMDEAGTPYCITVDYDSIKDRTVTVRERDSTDQIRIKIDELPALMYDLANEHCEFTDLTDDGAE